MTSDTTERWHRDGRMHFALGIEDTFVPQSSSTERAIDEYELTEHYQNYATDFKLAKDCGAELLRWGIPWHRVQPSFNTWDWGWLDSAADALELTELEPIIDLLHYGTPLWLEHQFANPDFPDRFAEFSDKVAERYQGRFRCFTPVNEPVVHSMFCGEYGYWPPYLTGSDGFSTIAVACACAASKAQRAIAERIGSESVFVHVEAGLSFIGDETSPEHKEQAERLRRQVFLVEDLLFGLVGQDHPLLPQLLHAGVDEAILHQLWMHPSLPDVMGVNYYPRHSTEVFEAGVHHLGGFADPRPALDRGAAGLGNTLIAFHDRYRVPVMLTETCVTGQVEERLDWLFQSVSQCLQLRQQGFPVVGYTWWPLFDMYEWTYRHSVQPREKHLLTMGLHDLVETDAGLLRKQNPVAALFRQCVESASQIP